MSANSDIKASSNSQSSNTLNLNPPAPTDQHQTFTSNQAAHPSADGGDQSSVADWVQDNTHSANGLQASSDSENHTYLDPIETREEQVDCQKKTWGRRRERKLI
ncbi:unnamed protein product [Tuber aestivum]|uniref:Uncharacterized protein n=1 Tax=Tuber aestivum TaxID=59557 RepID=A0A292PZ57_9PEZI|nr:unnamed protein product [Tuber aestivum]